MKILQILLVGLFLLSVNGSVFADRELERSEILQLFEQLTNQPRKTWVSAGTIKATHLEYKAPKTTDLMEISNEISQRIVEYQSNLIGHVDFA